MHNLGVLVSLSCVIVNTGKHFLCDLFFMNSSVWFELVTHAVVKIFVGLHLLDLESDSV